ncbi:unnamed protein product [Protopolystoma xenopodis]|uniref:Choline/carnitine acyltransferase domain-containing protein n=1 Tax=Protopolystoma xenopodis TaxID=117903 RepID=A0A448XMB4_9PLAT|nr:unnamed protein product [Protopolystoma xenopodis]
MIPCSDDVRHLTEESLAHFHQNRRRLPRKQRQHESSTRANRQLIQRNPPSYSGGIDLRISPPNTFARNGTSAERTSDSVSLFDHPIPEDLTDQGMTLMFGNYINLWADKSFNYLAFSDGRVGLNVEHSWSDAPVIAHLSEIIVNEK